MVLGSSYLSARNILVLGRSQRQGQVQPFACKLKRQKTWRQGDPPSRIFLSPCKQPLTLSQIIPQSYKINISTGFGLTPDASKNHNRINLPIISHTIYLDKLCKKKKASPNVKDSLLYLKTTYRTSPKISPSKYKLPPKPVTQKTNLVPRPGKSALGTRLAKNPPLNHPSKYKPPGGLYLENCPQIQSKTKQKW